MASCVYGRYTRTCTALEKCQRRGEEYHSELEIDIHGTPLGPLSSGRGGALLLPCSSRRLHTCNDHRMEKKKAVTAVRSKRKLLRWKQETGEIRNRCNILGEQQEMVD